MVDAIGKPRNIRYRQVTAGGKSALEATYTTSGTPGRAFAVTSSSGEVVVTTWTGFDLEEHAAGLPAYRLALSSVTYP